MKTAATACAALFLLTACAAQEGYMTPAGITGPAAEDQKEIDAAEQGIDQDTDAEGNYITVDA